MDRYTVTLTGKTPLLLHSDNIEWADAMDAWKNDPKNRAESKAGDDRSPAFRWIGCLYHNGRFLVVPQENIMRSIMEGGAMVPVPGGRGGKTFKSQTQSGIALFGESWLLTVGGKAIDVGPINAMKAESDFAAHKEFAKERGFELFIKRAKIGQSKHIRVRPMFRTWELSGELDVRDKQITKDILGEILEYSGINKGLGDWRPGGKTPGPYGTFTATVKKQ